MQTLNFNKKEGKALEIWQSTDRENAFINLKSEGNKIRPADVRRVVRANPQCTKRADISFSSALVCITKKNEKSSEVIEPKHIIRFDFEIHLNQECGLG